MSGQQLPVDPRLVVVPLEVADRREPDQVRIPLVRLGEEGEVGVTLPLNPPVVGDIDLAAHDRLDACAVRVPVELDCTGERPVIGERDRRHLELDGAGNEIRNPARSVEDRVLRVDVQMDERGAQRSAIVEPGPAGQPECCSPRQHFDSDILAPSRPSGRQIHPDGQFSADYGSAAEGRITLRRPRSCSRWTRVTEQSSRAVASR